MELSLKGVSKLYGENWIFKDINHHLSTGGKLAIQGPNGSGKSTLLSIIIGLTLPTRGDVSFSDQNGEVSKSEIGRRLSFTAPYVSLIDELTAEELLDRIRGFRSFISGMSVDNIIEMAILDKHRSKPINKYSTGMRQRLRLALALAMESDILILDEPTSNLDDFGKQWYQEILSRYLGDRTLIIASNEKADLKVCTEVLELTDYLA